MFSDINLNSFPPYSLWVWYHCCLVKVLVPTTSFSLLLINVIFICELTKFNKNFIKTYLDFSIDWKKYFIPILWQRSYRQLEQLYRLRRYYLYECSSLINGWSSDNFYVHLISFNLIPHLWSFELSIIFTYLIMDSLTSIFVSKFRLVLWFFHFSLLSGKNYQ